MEALVAAVRTARAAGVPYLVIGNGSNLLALRWRGARAGDQEPGRHRADDPAGRRGHSCRRTRADHAVTQPVAGRRRGAVPDAGAGQTVDAGWTGLEWGQSVPGTVGGGVVSNAGAHGGDLHDSLTRIWVLTAAGAVEEWPAERLALGYRTSIFKAHGGLARRSLAPGPVILRAELRLRARRPGRRAGADGAVPGRAPPHPAAGPQRG